METVVTNGEERNILVDEAYIKQSILEPSKDIVKGFQPIMPPLPVSEQEIIDIIAHIKELVEE